MEKPWRIGRKFGLERTVVREVGVMFGKTIALDRELWEDCAKDRLPWRQAARRLAADHEDTEYDKLQRQHDRRVAHPNRDINIKIRLAYFEEHAPYMKFLQPPTGKRINVFAPGDPTAEAGAGQSLENWSSTPRTGADIVCPAAAPMPHGNE